MELPSAEDCLAALRDFDERTALHVRRLRACEQRGKTPEVDLDQARESIASRKLKAAAVHIALVTGDRPEVLSST